MLVHFVGELCRRLAKVNGKYKNRKYSARSSAQCSGRWWAKLRGAQQKFGQEIKSKRGQNSHRGRFDHQGYFPLLARTLYLSCQTTLPLAMGDPLAKKPKTAVESRPKRFAKKRLAMLELSDLVATDPGHGSVEHSADRNAESSKSITAGQHSVEAGLTEHDRARHAPKFVTFGGSVLGHSAFMSGFYQQVMSDFSLGNGRPIYMRWTLSIGQIFLYFWDGGPGCPGWWVGPEVGGDSACAFCASSSWLPPEAGWYIVDPNAPFGDSASRSAAPPGRDVLLPSVGFRTVDKTQCVRCCAYFPQSLVYCPTCGLLNEKNTADNFLVSKSLAQRSSSSSGLKRRYPSLFQPPPPRAAAPPQDWFGVVDCVFSDEDEDVNGTDLC